MQVAQGCRTGASQKEQIGAEHSQGMGKTVQQGMFLLRSARAPRIVEKGQDKIDEGPSRIGLVEYLGYFRCLSSITSRKSGTSGGGLISEAIPLLPEPPLQKVAVRRPQSESPH